MRENLTSNFIIEPYGNFISNDDFQSIDSFLLQTRSPVKKVTFDLFLGIINWEKRKMFIFVTCNVSPFAGFAWFLDRAVLNYSHSLISNTGRHFGRHVLSVQE